MLSPDRSKIHSNMDTRVNTQDVEPESDEESHIEDNTGQGEIRAPVTSFSVKDILDPNKFTTATLRRRSSDSEGDSDSELRENPQASAWHPWMSATRYNRPSKAHGESLNLL